MLRNLRAVIFPNNSLGPPAPPPPSPEQVLAIRRTAAADLLSVVPGPTYRTLFAPHATSAEVGEEISVAHVESILDCLGDEKVNKYLIYGVLECIFVRLVPELADKTPSELLAERGLGADEMTVEENTVF